MFKFNFLEDNNEDRSDQDKVSEVNNETIQNTIWIESEEIAHETLGNVAKLVDSNTINTISCGSIEIKYLNSSKVLDLIGKSNVLKGSSILSAEQNHSDLVTAIYEGGLKVWECTYDLLNFISDNNIDFVGKKVLDLGCGVGIIGIVAVLKGASCYFQDYNIDVLKYITVPNVMLNISNKITSNQQNCRFYCGDWKSFLNLINQNFINNCDKFDYIFTSETIYSRANYHKLVDVFQHLLKDNGLIYLAAKCYYFGVGGNIPEFQECVRKENVFDCCSVWNCSDGVKREILKINFKQ